MTTLLEPARAQKMALSFLLLFLVAPALAADGDKQGQSGPVPLSNLEPLVVQSAKLQDEVTAELGRIGKKVDDIACQGNRFPSEWTHFGSARVAPYNCNFDGKWLTIEAEVHVAGPDGRVYPKITPAVMKSAVKVVETHPVWRWSAHAPGLE